jgi:hypothetical protein
MTHVILRNALPRRRYAAPETIAAHASHITAHSLHSLHPRIAKRETSCHDVHTDPELRHSGLIQWGGERHAHIFHTGHCPRRQTAGRRKTQQRYSILFYWIPPLFYSQGLSHPLFRRACSGRR